MADLSKREIITARVFDASLDLLWKAFATPESLAKWWGPKGFTNTFHEFDLRPGGHWRFVMHGPDGVDYPNHSVFLEVLDRTRIVFRHLDPVHDFQMTITFSDTDGKTTLTWQMLFASASHRDEIRSFVERANEENLDRLADVLAELS